MPALFDSLVHSQGLTPHKAWRVAYIVPFIIITSVALGMLFFCPDTPTGKWSERHLHVPQQQESQTVASGDEAGIVTPTSSIGGGLPLAEKNEKKTLENNIVEPETQAGEVLDHHHHHVVVPPTFKKILHVATSKHSLALALPYACSFGGELAINSILGAYYFKNFPELGQTKSGQWAAMFGLLNVFFRPAGGIIGDFIYHHTSSVWAKKLWVTFLGVTMGAFEIAIGFSNPHSQATMFGLVAGCAFFMDASNGANFAVVPHVHPKSNGILSGMVGALGNLGGVIFAIVFRYNGKDYGKAIWIIGVMSVAINLLVSWIPPMSAEDKLKEETGRVSHVGV
jgi:NNP family nitrate/nitrite transporter-like MFS transporter